MRFCRSCYAVLKDDETICDACGTSWEGQEPASSTPRERPSQVPAREKSTKISKNHVGLFSSLRHIPRLESTSLTVQKRENGKFSTIVMITGLIVFASYLLWQHTIHSQVITDIHRQTLDETFRMLILSQLRAQPTAYYSIADRFFRQIYMAAGPPFSNDFPLIFYIWLLAPTIGDIKWLYLPFALTGTIASYFAIYVATKQRWVGVFSAAWMAYFLETQHYLTYEYWSASIFLIGLALFFMKHHVSAAMMIGLATLIKEVFAPFLLFASIYYLVVSRQDWRSNIHNLAIGRRRLSSQFTDTGNTKKAFVWTMATCSAGLIWYINGLVSTAGKAQLTEAGFHDVAGFKPELLPLLFGGTQLRNPLTLGSLQGEGGHPIILLPAVVAIALALIGMASLGKDERIVMYASFAFLPLLVPFGVIRVGNTIATTANLPARWVVMSIIMVNLFWLAGIYKICEYTYHGYIRIVSEDATASGNRNLYETRASI